MGLIVSLSYASKDNIKKVNESGSFCDLSNLRVVISFVKIILDKIFEKDVS